MKVPILDPGGLFNDYELHKVNPVSCKIEDMDGISHSKNRTMRLLQAKSQNSANLKGKKIL